MKNKIYAALAIIAIVGIIYSTAIYVPEGYTTVTRDGESLYPEGLHLFQKYPFENVQPIQLSRQCDVYNKDYVLDNGGPIKANIGVCWEIMRVADKIKGLYLLNDDIDINQLARLDFRADPTHYKEAFIHPAIMVGSIKTIAKYNISNFNPDNPDIRQDIMKIAQQELNSTGIIVTEISISLPDFGPFESAIKQRNEKKKQEEAEIIKAKEEINRLEQSQNNTANTTWINDVPENQADFFIQSTRDALYARLVDERITGIVPTLSFSKGPSRYGVPGFIGIYSP